MVTATLATQDGVNFYLEDLSHTYQQIEQAIISGQAPVLAVNIDIIATGATTFASLTGYVFNNSIQFSAIGDFAEVLTKSVALLFSDGTNFVTIEEVKEDKTYFVDAEIVLNSNQNMMVRFDQDFETVQNAIKNGYNVIARTRADLLQSGLVSMVPLSYYREDSGIVFETISYYSNTYYRYTASLLYNNATQFVMIPLEFSGSGEKEVEIITGTLGKDLEVTSLSHNYAQISTLLQNGKEVRLKLAEPDNDSSVLYLNFSCNISNQIHIFSTIVSLFGATFFYVVLIDSDDAISVTTDGIPSIDNLLQVMAASGISEGNKYFTTSDIVYKAFKDLKAEDIGALSEETLNTALTEALAAAKASGLFDGKDGKDGEDGQDGQDGQGVRDGATKRFEQKPNSNDDVRWDDEATLERLVSRIENQHIDITADYNTWVKVGFAIANTMGAGGSRYFHRISQNYPRYDYNQTERLYASCLRSNNGAVTLGTLVFLIHNA